VRAIEKSGAPLRPEPVLEVPARKPGEMDVRESHCDAQCLQGALADWPCGIVNITVHIEPGVPLELPAETMGRPVGAVLPQSQAARPDLLISRHVALTQTRARDG
jgi:hypothetical protein